MMMWPGYVSNAPGSGMDLRVIERRMDEFQQPVTGDEINAVCQQAVSIHGLTVKGSCESVLGQPGVAGQGAGDGVQDGQSVVSG